jgi:hypothetical protein
MSGIAPKQNALKFKIAPHKQTFIVKKNSRKMGPLANGTLCTSEHNDKSGTDPETCGVKNEQVPKQIIH